MQIELQDIQKSFGRTEVLKDISLKVHGGELMALLGPSGSGKTTLLRIIAGLEFPTGGRLLFDGKDATNRRAQERGVGFVFQHYALFRHMTVFENVAFGLKVKPAKSRPAPAEIRSKVDELLKLVQLDWLSDRLPANLSGGQRQRVALARALAVEPRVLLLDEPFGSLDAKVRQELRRWLRRLHDRIHITSVFVTHDQEEALEVADRVVVLNKGSIEQVGTPEEIYESPSSPFVFNFLGNVNLFHGRVEGGKAYIGDATMEINEPHNGDIENAMLFVRPHQMDIDHKPPGQHHFRARVRHINATGPLVKVELVTQWGDSVFVELPQERFRVLQLRRDLEVFVSPRTVTAFSRTEA